MITRRPNVILKSLDNILVDRGANLFIDIILKEILDAWIWIFLKFKAIDINTWLSWSYFLGWCWKLVGFPSLGKCILVLCSSREFKMNVTLNHDFLVWHHYLIIILIFIKNTNLWSRLLCVEPSKFADQMFLSCWLSLFTLKAC